MTYSGLIQAGAAIGGSMIRTIICVIGLFAFWIAHANAGEMDRCISNQESRPMLASGEVVPFPDAAQRQGVTLEHLNSVRLCRSGDHYVCEVETVQGSDRSSMQISAEPVEPN